MANRKTRVKYNPRTRELPGTNLALLARALQLIARREARFQQQAETQPCGELTFTNSTNLWSQSGTTSGASSTASKENSSSSFSSSSGTDTSTSTTSKVVPKSKKRKTPPSVYQQEIARKKRERLQRETPQHSFNTTTSITTPHYHTSPISPKANMERWVANDAARAKPGSQARHDAYHGTTHPDTEIQLPIVQTKRRISSVDDEPPYVPSKKSEEPPLPPSKKRKTNGSILAFKSNKVPRVDKFVGPLLLTKAELEAEKTDCHFCQLESFSTHTDYPITVENVMDDGSTFPKDFKFIEYSSFGTGVERCDPAFRAGCNCASAKECQGGSCTCHNPDDEGNMPYHTRGPMKGCLKKAYLNSPLAIFECHDACIGCKDCPKRVVDSGRKIPLTIFRTIDGRGWGVKSTVDLRAGQFVDKYIGEILTQKAADHRRKTADRAERKDIYLFALDKFKDEETWDGQQREIHEVDGEFFGGPTRFINHSCDPNLRIFARVGDESDKHIHDLAFFAIEDIKAGTEFTFDYVDSQPEDAKFEGLTEEEIAAMKRDMASCLCGSDKCRKWLW